MTTVVPHHHLDEATLVSYSAGALPAALALVAATHLGMCAHCRRRLRDADMLGGALLMQGEVAPRPALARAAMLARLATAPEPSDPIVAPPAASDDPDMLPPTLHPYFGERYSTLPWRFLAPGVRHLRARGVEAGKLMLLKFAPGVHMPEHGHGNSEMTLVLKGAYRDELGRFQAGDVADLDSGRDHRPVAELDEPCISLAGTDAPLRFKGLTARLFQPWLRV